jgi:hypothetical protein
LLGRVRRVPLLVRRAIRLAVAGIYFVGGPLRGTDRGGRQVSAQVAL